MKTSKPSTGCDLDHNLSNAHWFRVEGFGLGTRLGFLDQGLGFTFWVEGRYDCRNGSSQDIQQMHGGLYTSR